VTPSKLFQAVLRFDIVSALLLSRGHNDLILRLREKVTIARPIANGRENDLSTLGACSSGIP